MYTQYLIGRCCSRHYASACPPYWRGQYLLLKLKKESYIIIKENFECKVRYVQSKQSQISKLTLVLGLSYS